MTLTDLEGGHHTAVMLCQHYSEQETHEHGNGSYVYTKRWNKKIGFNEERAMRVHSGHNRTILRRASGHSSNRE